MAATAELTVTFNLHDYEDKTMRLFLGEEAYARFRFKRDGGDPDEIERLENIFGVTHEEIR